MEPIEAVIRSSAQRLRPVFLTTVTAIGGLLPMMFAMEIDFWTRIGDDRRTNARMWVQLSTAVIFGLAFSKMITLGLVPAMLALPYRVRESDTAASAAGHRDVASAHRPGVQALAAAVGASPRAAMAQPAE